MIGIIITGIEDTSDRMRIRGDIVLDPIRSHGHVPSHAGHIVLNLQGHVVIERGHIPGLVMICSGTSGPTVLNDTANGRIKPRVCALNHAGNNDRTGQNNAAIVRTSMRGRVPNCAGDNGQQGCSSIVISLVRARACASCHSRRSSRIREDRSRNVTDTGINYWQSCWQTAHNWLQSYVADKMDIDSEKAKIQMHVDHGNYHAAINIAISAMNQCRRHHDQNGVDTFLQVISDIVQTMTDEFGATK